MLPVTVALGVDRDALRTGELATFRLSPSDVAADPAVGWRIQWGDDPGSQLVTGKAEFYRWFARPGRYTVRVALDRKNPDARPITLAPDSVTVEVAQLTVDVDPERVVAGEEVALSTPFHASPLQPDITYRFVADDGFNSGWLNEPRTTHVFPAPGTRRVSVEIGKSREKVTTSAVREIEVVAPPKEGLALAAEPRQPKPNDPVAFSASPLNAHDGIEYRFMYGDGATSAWGASATSSHAYAASGSYAARAEARFGGRTIRSDVVTLAVRSGSTPIRPFLIALVAVLAVTAAGATWVVRRARASESRPASRVRVRSQIDPGEQRVVRKAGGPLVAGRRRSDA